MMNIVRFSKEKKRRKFLNKYSLLEICKIMREKKLKPSLCEDKSLGLEL